jgi:rhodanese-related sulfurtransferase
VPTAVDIEQVRRLLERGAQLIEVLPSNGYDEEHLPGAVSVPLQELTPDTVERLDPARPVIAYCYDYQ